MYTMLQNLKKVEVSATMWPDLYINKSFMIVYMKVVLKSTEEKIVKSVKKPQAIQSF